MHVFRIGINLGKYLGLLGIFVVLLMACPLAGVAGSAITISHPGWGMGGHKRFCSYI